MRASAINFKDQSSAIKGAGPCFGSSPSRCATRIVTDRYSGGNQMTPPEGNCTDRPAFSRIRFTATPGGLFFCTTIATSPRQRKKSSDLMSLLPIFPCEKDTYCRTGSDQDVVSGPSWIRSLQTFEIGGKCLMAVFTSLHPLIKLGHELCLSLA
jgi:hypothetical protein